MSAVAIFGATSSIGLNVAKKFAQTGFTSVHMVARNTEKLNHYIKKIRSEYPSVDFHHNLCDVFDELSIQNSAKIIRKITSEQHHKLCSVIYCVGMRKDQLLVRSSDQDLQSIINCNLLGALRVCKHMSKQLISQQSGSIVLIGSMVGNVGNVGQCAYASSKAGLIGLTRSLSQELINKNIFVNLISPGYVDTPFISDLDLNKIKDKVPLGRIANSNEIAGCVHFLATTRSIAGQNLIVDGGMNLIY